MMNNMNTMFDLNKIDSQGGKVETTNQHSEQAAVNALEVRNLNFYFSPLLSIIEFQVSNNYGKE